VSSSKFNKQFFLQKISDSAVCKADKSDKIIIHLVTFDHEQCGVLRGLPWALTDFLAFCLGNDGPANRPGIVDALN
jgi:hypothetical protein